MAWLSVIQTTWAVALERLPRFRRGNQSWTMPGPNRRAKKPGSKMPHICPIRIKWLRRDIYLFLFVCFFHLEKLRLFPYWSYSQAKGHQGHPVPRKETKT